MTLRSLSAVALVVLFGSLLELHAQPTPALLPPHVIRGLDSALGGIQMTRSDLTMRWETFSRPDTHRLAVVQRLFADPLATFTESDELAQAAFASSESYEGFFDRVARSMEWRGGIHTTRPLPNDADVELATGIVMVRELDSVAVPLLKPFLALAVATDAATTSTRGAIGAERVAKIVDYIDSLLTQSEGAGESTPLQMRLEERYGIERNKRFFNQEVAGLDYGRMVAPGATMFQMALTTARVLDGELKTMKSDQVRTKIIPTPLGLVAIGGPGDDVYDGEFLCIVDVGGNDIYRTPRRSKERAFDRATSLIIDFSGDDTYLGEDFAVGGSLFGSSVVIDMHGNDSYTARNFSLGSALFGTGILYDNEGSDRYSGGTMVEGAAGFGLGLVIDAAGNDNYLAHLTSQGFGYTRGFGGIVDMNGNDSYIAASPYTDYLRYDDHFETFCQGAALGARPVASGGIGIIAEGGGNDTYIADIFGQGSAYWYGIGGIVDRTGNDSYTAYQYAQGAGIHFAFGALIDTSGHDTYVSHGVSQGCGHDVGFGGLYDAKGDDNYVVESLSLGGGNANAISLFVDGGGEDGYLARRDNTLGFSDLRRDYSMIGVFLDLDKKDFYGTARGGNDTLWTGSYHGAGLDAQLRPLDTNERPAGTAPPVAKTPEQIDSELAPDIATLFVQASAAPQKYQYLVEPARARMILWADSTLPFMLSMLNTESAREALAIGVMLPKMGPRIIAPLVDTIRTGELSRRGRAIYALGELKDTTAAPALADVIADTTQRWGLRGAAGEALLKMRATSVKPQLYRALSDPIDIVRGYAARAYIMVADSAELAALLPLLNDPSHVVRWQTVLGLQRRGVDTVSGSIAAMLRSQPRGFARTLLLDLARDMKSASGRAAVAGALVSSADPGDRATAIRMALVWKEEAAYAALRSHRAAETDATVLALYNQIPAAPKPERKPKSGKTGGKDEQGSPRSGAKSSSSKSSAHQTSTRKSATPGVGARSRSGR